MTRHYIDVFFLCAAYSPSVDAVQFQTISSDGYNPTHNLAWFHAPKTGTSFGATPMHYANSSLPAEEGADLLMHWAGFWAKYPIEVWFKDGMWKETCDHASVSEEVYQSYQGRFVGLFREPRSRLISAYFQKGSGARDVLEYAHRAEGSVAMQLAGQAAGEKWLRWPGKQYCGGQGGYGGKATPDINLALSRLREGFMFVGLTEEYDLSVCLFHAMFGGECLPVEFQNMRPGKHNGYSDVRSQEVAERLEGYYDVVDGQLYDAARQIFWKSVAKHHVSRSSCLKICPQAGDIFASTLNAKLANQSDYEYHWPGRYYLHDPDDEELFEHLDAARSVEEKLLIGK